MPGCSKKRAAFLTYTFQPVDSQRIYRPQFSPVANPESDEQEGKDEIPKDKGGWSRRITTNRTPFYTQNLLYYSTDLGDEITSPLRQFTQGAGPSEGERECEWFFGLLSVLQARAWYRTTNSEYKWERRPPQSISGTALLG